MAFRRFSYSVFENRKLLLQSLACVNEKAKAKILVKVNGREFEGVSNETTAFDVFKGMRIDLPIAVKVKYNGFFSEQVTPTEGEVIKDSEFEIYDLNRPLESDCELNSIQFLDPLGQRIFWHSSSHILGSALESLTGGLLTNGPATAHGFYYDISTNTFTLTPSHLEELSKTCQKLISSSLPFTRFLLTKQQALELFNYNPYKLHFIQNKVPDNGITSVYQIGDFIDLCAGPHVINTSVIKALKLTETSASHWLGDTSKPLQRVYGISFPSQKLLDAHLQQLAEAARRDHRKTGTHLYFWHPFSAGSAFFLPEGTKIYNKLISFLRKEYLYRGFTEVISPNLYNSDLWKQSGHYYKYKDDMYFLKAEEELGLKPMNCPGHCLIFDHFQRSYKELPLRLAEFGVLHRNEISGALSGLTRVRRFVQDDSHIFCRKDQIKSEVLGCLDFVDYIYKIFGFEYELELSTKPKNALGSEEIWESAENQLREALEEHGKEYKECKGEGAFYGPKIDIKVKDAMGRSHQCGTVQLDFNLPKRFDLQFKTEDSKVASAEPVVKYEDFEESEVKQGFERPVIIHRAILGSIERFIAVLTEHFAGKWPFWLSPRQLILLPISEKFEQFTESVALRLKLEGYHVEVDKSATSLNKKIRTAHLSNYNYIGVIGEVECQSNTIDIRDRESNKSIGKYSLSQILSLFATLVPPASEAQKSSHMSAFNDFITETESFPLKDLEAKLSKSPYINGDCLSETDTKLFDNFQYPPCPQHFPYTADWFSRIEKELKSKKV